MKTNRNLFPDVLKAVFAFETFPPKLIICVGILCATHSTIFCHQKHSPALHGASEQTIFHVIDSTTFLLAVPLASRISDCRTKQKQESHRHDVTASSRNKRTAMQAQLDEWKYAKHCRWFTVFVVFT